MFVYEFCRKYGYETPKNVSSYTDIFTEVEKTGCYRVHKGDVLVHFALDRDEHFIKKYLIATIYYKDINAGVFEFNTYDELNEIVKQIEKGKVQCSVCGKMIDIEDSDFCMFAGRKCKTCDDPNLDIALD